MDSPDTELNLYDYEDFANRTFNYSPGEEVAWRAEGSCFSQAPCVLLLLTDVLICLLGLGGNGLVIWMAAFSMKRSVTTSWYLSLAVSDFLFCAFLPLNIVYGVTSQWTFGLFMCKFSSFVMFLNMFGSIFLLVVISLDRCVSVTCPVWAQNHRSVGKASAVILLAWLLSAALSVPSAVFRDVQLHLGTSRCLNNYTWGPHSHRSVALSRFAFGFLLPLLLITLCYAAIVLRLRASHMAKSSKPFRIMTALVLTFFLCWLPYHTFVLLELSQVLPVAALSHGLKVGTTVAAANSFLNPLLYVFVGSDFRKKFKSSFLSKMENAIAEDGRTVSRYLSRSSSVDARASSHL